MTTAIRSIEAAAFSVALLPSLLHAAPSVVVPARAVAGTHTCAYPEAANREDLQGDVLLRYDVDASGRTTHVVLVKSSGYSLLDRAALRCVSTTWKNVPATRDGIKVASLSHNALVRFKLSAGPTAAAIPKAIRVALALAILVVLACLVIWRRGPSPHGG